MTNLIITKLRFIPLQEQEPFELFLSEGLSCTAFAHWLCIPVSSLAN